MYVHVQVYMYCHVGMRLVSLVTSNVYYKSVVFLDNFISHDFRSQDCYFKCTHVKFSNEPKIATPYLVCTNNSNSLLVCLELDDKSIIIIFNHMDVVVDMVCVYT